MMESFVCSDININFLTNNEASVCFYFVRRWLFTHLALNSSIQM